MLLNTMANTLLSFHPVSLFFAPLNFPLFLLLAYIFSDFPVKSFMWLFLIRVFYSRSSLVTIKSFSSVLVI